MSEIGLSNAPAAALALLGVGFLGANLWLVGQFIRYFRHRSRALVTWPGRRPPHYGIFLGLGVVFAILIVVKVFLQGRPPSDAFGEGMMLLYYAYLWPLSFRIGRGLYEDGVWAESGFVPYGAIDGLSWREDPDLTLVVISRARRLARSLSVPDRHYGEVRRLLRDKIASHDIDLTGKAFDLGADERGFV